MSNMFKFEKYVLWDDRSKPNGDQVQHFEMVKLMVAENLKGRVKNPQFLIQYFKAFDFNNPQFLTFV